MPQVKVVFEAEKEIRRYLLPATGTFQDLTGKIRSVLGDTVNFRLVWQDADGDFVVCESESELQTALDLTAAAGSQNDVLRLHLRVTGQATPRGPSAPASVTTSPAPSIFDQVTVEDDMDTTLQGQTTPVPPQPASEAKKPEEKPKVEQPTGPKEHIGVSCDCCDGRVIGTRFKCTKCRNYDLCETCKGKGFHSEHPLEAIAEPRTRGDFSNNPWMKLFSQFAGGAPQAGGQPGFGPFPGMQGFMRQPAAGCPFRQQNAGTGGRPADGAGCGAAGGFADGSCGGGGGHFPGFPSGLPDIDEVAQLLQSMGINVDGVVIRELMEQFQGDIHKIIEAMS